MQTKWGCWSFGNGSPTGLVTCEQDTELEIQDSRLPYVHKSSLPTDKKKAKLAFMAVLLSVLETEIQFW